MQETEDIWSENIRVALDWFKIHVEYRAAMQRYLLLSSGVLAVAYVNLLAEDRIAAGALGLVGAFVTLAFSLLEVITNIKIQGCKRVVRSVIVSRSEAEPRLLPHLTVVGALFGGTEERLDEGTGSFVLHDPTWTALAEGTLVTFFVAAALYAWVGTSCWLAIVSLSTFVAYVGTAVTLWRRVSRIE